MEEYVGLMAMRSVTSHKSAVWVGHLEVKNERTQKQFFCVFEFLLKKLREENKLLSLVKEANKEWLFALPHATMSSAFVELQSKKFE
jgi:hypothetical protein